MNLSKTVADETNQTSVTSAVSNTLSPAPKEVAQPPIEVPQVAQLPVEVSQFDSMPRSAYIRPKSIALILSVSLATVWRLLKSKKLPSKNLTERTVVVTVGAVRDFMAGTQGGE